MKTSHPCKALGWDLEKDRLDSSCALSSDVLT